MEKLYMNSNVYVPDNSKSSKEFAQKMVEEHGKNVTISATTPDGKPAYIKGGVTYVLDHKIDRSGQGTNWVGRLQKLVGGKNGS